MSLLTKGVRIEILAASGERRIQSNTLFPSPVNHAGVAINGFNLDYTGGDRNLGRVMVDVNILGWNGTRVDFEVQCQLRDNSGNDEYEGYVTVLIIADVA